MMFMFTNNMHLVVALADKLKIISMCTSIAYILGTLFIAL